MLGMNIFLKQLMIQRGVVKALERLELYLGRLRGGNNGRAYITWVLNN